MRSHLRICIQNREDPVINEDLIYFYHFLCKNGNHDIENTDTYEILEDLLSHVKTELHDLESLIPGSKYEYVDKALLTKDSSTAPNFDEPDDSVVSDD